MYQTRNHILSGLSRRRSYRRKTRRGPGYHSRMHRDTACSRPAAFIGSLFRFPDDPGTRGHTPRRSDTGCIRVTVSESTNCIRQILLEQKEAKRRNFWLTLIAGIIFLFLVPPMGVILLVISLFLSKRWKAYPDTPWVRKTKHVDNNLTQQAHTVVGQTWQMS